MNLSNLRWCLEEGFESKKVRYSRSSKEYFYFLLKKMSCFKWETSIPRKYLRIHKSWMWNLVCENFSTLYIHLESNLRLFELRCLSVRCHEVNTNEVKCDKEGDSNSKYMKNKSHHVTYPLQLSSFGIGHVENKSQ